MRRRLASPSRSGRRVVYWLNPGVILGAVLGYLDPQYALPAAASLIAASAGWFVSAGALAAAALLTKPQAVVALPALAFVLWGEPGMPGLKSRLMTIARMALGALLVTVLLVAPVFAAGGGPNFIQAMSRLAAHDMLSGNACNLWWVVGYLVRVQYTVQDYGLWGALVRPTQILQISRFMDVGYPNPRPIGAIPRQTDTSNEPYARVRDLRVTPTLWRGGYAWGATY